MDRSAGDEQLPDLVLISLWHQPCWPLPCLFPGTALGLFDVSSSDALQLKRAFQSSPTGTLTLRLGVCFISMPPCQTPEASLLPPKELCPEAWPLLLVPQMPSCLSWLSPLQHNSVPWVSNGVTIAVISTQGQECILRKVSICDIRACLTVSDSVGQETLEKVKVRLLPEDPFWCEQKHLGEIPSIVKSF